MISNAAEALAQARRVVVKIGSALLVDVATGELKSPWLESVVADVEALRADGKQVVLVSSGAIALGRGQLGLAPGSLRLDESQAAAATGQIRLAHAFESAFGRVGIRVAQILVTLGDTEERGRYLNARRTINTLLELDALPVVNENDTVATEEIRYGDNDRLAARVAQMIGADCLVLLSDVDGLYTADPVHNADARFVPVVPRITAEIEAMAGEAVSVVGSGGMKTKLIAARIAVHAGCHVALAGGFREHPLTAIREGGRHTYFAPEGTPRAARKQWIAGSLEPRGTVTIDAGAASALAADKSLLAAGVTAVEGEFGRGAAVRVVDPEGRVIAVGLCSYDSRDSARLCGCRSADIEAVLGYRGRAEIIHRDDLVYTG